MIIDEITKLENEWSSLKEEFHVTKKEASLRFGELETLILYFEQEMLIVSFAAQPHLIGQVRHITEDINSLN